MIRKLNEELKQQKSVNKHGLAENANLRVQLAVRTFWVFSISIRLTYIYQTANQNRVFIQDCQRACQQINADSKKLKFQMQEEKNNYLANFEKQKEKLLLEQKRLVSSNTALVNQNDILKTTLESREVAWRRQVQLLEEKGNVINFPTRYSRTRYFFLEKVVLYGRSWQLLSDIEIAKLKKQNLEISEEMNKMKLKFETESRVLSDRFQFASNQVDFL